MKIYKEGRTIQSAMHSATGSGKVQRFEGQRRVARSMRESLTLAGGAGGLICEKWVAPLIMQNRVQSEFEFETSGTISKSNKWANKNKRQQSSLSVSAHLLLSSLFK